MKILFMCIANSVRSQLAEGIAKHIFGAKAEIKSAGSMPTYINPYTIRALVEVGVDYRNLQAKSIDDLPRNFVENLDYVITLCAEEICPAIVSKAKKLHWSLPDPTSKDGSDEELMERFRILREEIWKRLKQLKEMLEKEASFVATP